MDTRQKMREKIPEIAIEVGSIVLGVLLALAVNEWREVRKTKQLVGHATENVIGELWRNRSVLESSLPGHRRIVEVLENLASGEVDPNQEPLGDELFNPVFLRSSAWEAAMTTGAIGAMPYDAVSSYSEIYNYQEAVSTAMDTFMKASMNEDPNCGTAQFQAAANALRILVVMEEELLAIYQGHLDGDGSFKSLLQIMTRER